MNVTGGDALARLRSAVAGTRADWNAYVLEVLPGDGAALARDPETPHALDSLAGLEGVGRRVATLRRALGWGVTGAGAGSLADPEMPEDLVVPDGYRVEDGAIWTEGDAPTLVARQPIYISALVRDVSPDPSAAQYVELRWRTWGREGPRWRSSLEGREAIATRSRVGALARMGAPVSEVTWSRVSEWLGSWEAVNVGRLPMREATVSMGWQGRVEPENDAARCYLWGWECIGGNVALQASEGYAQHADGYVQGGTWAGWEDIWSAIQPHPRVALSVYAALAPVMLGIVPGAQGFVVDWSGRTSGGKTTALRVAASVWGRPNDLIAQWSSTPTAMERLSSFLTDLPVLLDDTKQAKDPEFVASTIYQVCGLKGKLRGSVDGMRRVATLRTVLLSTGETPATRFTQDMGARARCVAVRGFPFSGGESAANRSLADWLTVATSEDFGHVGPACVRWLAENRARWPEIRRRWTEWREALGKGDSGVKGRSAGYLATLRLAAWVASEACGLAVHEGALEEAALCAEDSAQDADTALAALREVLQYLESHRADVYQGRGDAPARCIGRWVDDPGETPAIVWGIARDVVEEVGHDWDAIRAEWKRRGWLKLDGEGKTRTSVRVGAERPVWMLGFTEAAMAAAGEPGDNDTPEG